MYEKETKDDDFESRRGRQNRLRGRKDKYYEQVDDEDQNFATDNMGHLIDEDDEEDEDLLDKIEEES